MYQLDLISIINLFWKEKIKIISITGIFAIFSVFIALSLPNIYISSALLSPKNELDSLSSKLGNFNQIPNIAGIDLSGENATVSDEAIARIRSFEFFSKNFLPKINLENLMAVKKWHRKENKLIYDDKVFDSQLKKWVRKVRFPKKVVPSAQESYLVYQDILRISTDKKTGFVSISISHKSSYIAEKWLTIIIDEINENMRLKDRLSAENSIAFLNQYAKSTKIQSLQDAIANLLEVEMKSLMLTYNNESYIYDLIDSPVVPEKKSKPRRALICIFITFLGGVISLIIVLFQNGNQINKEKH